jgi:hypothetical protein
MLGGGNDKKKKHDAAPDLQPTIEKVASLVSLKKAGNVKWH